VGKWEQLRESLRHSLKEKFGLHCPSWRDRYAPWACEW